MTITFTELDRRLLMTRFRVAAKKRQPNDVVTVLHITEAYIEQQEE